MKTEITWTGFFGETGGGLPVNPGRWTVVLCNERGAVISTADFATEEEATEYRKSAEQTAEAIDGEVRVVGPEGDTK